MLGIKTLPIDLELVFIECPSSLLVRAQMYSNYKKHNTVKFLIGITPKDLLHLFLRDGEEECQMFT